MALGVDVGVDMVSRRGVDLDLPFMNIRETVGGVDMGHSARIMMPANLIKGRLNLIFNVIDCEAIAAAGKECKRKGGVGFGLGCGNGDEDGECIDVDGNGHVYRSVLGWGLGSGKGSTSGNCKGSGKCESDGLGRGGDSFRWLLSFMV